MPLSPLKNWAETSANLHQAAELLGAVHKLYRERMPNYLHLPLQVVPEGLSTHKLPQGGEVVLDFTQGALAYRPDQGESVSLALADHSQESLLIALLQALRDGDFATTFSGVADDALISTMAAALEARGPGAQI